MGKFYYPKTWTSLELYPKLGPTKQEHVLHKHRAHPRVTRQWSLSFFEKNFYWESVSSSCVGVYFWKLGGFFGIFSFHFEFFERIWNFKIWYVFGIRCPESRAAYARLALSMHLQGHARKSYLKNLMSFCVHDTLQ